MHPDPPMPLPNVQSIDYDSISLQLPSGLSITAASRDPLLYLLNEIVVRNVYTRGGFYQPRPGDTIIDVGANIGVFTLYLLGLEPNLTIHCFEPEPETRARLQHNVFRNNLTCKVCIHAEALSHDTRPRVLFTNRWSGNTSFFSRPGSQSSEIVDCITLVEAFSRVRDNESIELLKLDIEGAESEALALAQTANWSRVRRIAVECHDFLFRGACAHVCQVLAGYGFAVVDIIPDPDSPQSISVVRACRPEVGRGRGGGEGAEEAQRQQRPW